MEVLFQKWTICGMRICSISKDAGQLRKEAAKKGLKRDGKKRLVGKPVVATIHGNHTLARIVQTRTVFILPEEVKAIKFNN
jgi:hypothetical protein